MTDKQIKYDLYGILQSNEPWEIYLHIIWYLFNKLAFGQTRFAAAADPIEHISEEKFLLQIFSKMGNLMI